MIDYHLHLVPHGGGGRFSAETVRGYARAAADSGVDEIAVTEHLFRFPDVQDALGAWWESDPDPSLREQMAGYFAAERLDQTLAEYVDVVLEAAGGSDGGADVRLGLEVDLFAGRMAEVVELIAGHPWDVLLGAVHWVGAWGFDNLDDPVVAREWHRRHPDEVWLAYVAAVEEMAASGACDVLAHPDLAKVAGVHPGTAAVECEERLVKAAESNGLHVEVNTAGWRKPVAEAYPSPEMLAAMHAAGVGVTLGSDAHRVELVADRIADAASLAAAAGYREVTTFAGRRPTRWPLVTGAGGA